MARQTHGTTFVSNLASSTQKALTPRPSKATMPGKPRQIERTSGIFRLLGAPEAQMQSTAVPQRLVEGHDLCAASGAFVPPITFARAIWSLFYVQSSWSWPRPSKCYQYINWGCMGCCFRAVWRSTRIRRRPEARLRLVLPCGRDRTLDKRLVDCQSWSLPRGSLFDLGLKILLPSPAGGPQTGIARLG